MQLTEDARNEARRRLFLFALRWYKTKSTFSLSFASLVDENVDGRNNGLVVEVIH
jgi:hypothetical protein